jgi:hypothetical protein
MKSTLKLAAVPAEFAPEALSETYASAEPAMTVRVARSRAEVEEIRGIWSAWPSHRDSDIDFCLELVWAREEVLRPHVIVVYRDGLPEAMLVGRLERTRMTSRIGYLRLPGISSRSLTFSYGGLLGNVSPQSCGEIIASIRSSLRQDDADMALLEGLRVGSRLYDGALRASGFATRDHLVKPALRHMMGIPSDIKDVYAALSANHRSDLKRKAKKLMADHQGSVRVRCYREPGKLDDVIPQVEEIAKKTYQRGLGVGFQDTDEIRRRLRFCAEKGWLRIYILYLGDAPSAFWIGTLYQDCFCSDYLAFDPHFGAYSPGTFLLMKVVEEFCGAGVKEIDFGPGEGRYKEQFGNMPSNEASVFVFAPRPRGILLNGVRTSAGLVDTLMRKILDGTKLLPSIKKIWRSRLAKKAARA